MVVARGAVVVVAEVDVPGHKVVEWSGALQGILFRFLARSDMKGKNGGGGGGCGGEKLWGKGLVCPGGVSMCRKTHSCPYCSHHSQSIYPKT